MRYAIKAAIAIEISARAFAFISLLMLVSCSDSQPGSANKTLFDAF